MTNREPLPYGTTIRYHSAVAVVIDDHGGDTLEVECEGFRQRWRWEFEGVKCTVVEKQEAGNGKR